MCALYVPDAQRGTAVVGGPGSGKTFSAIDPLIRSAINQGFPTIVYDFKYPAQTRRIVAYALKRGYRVNIFAPGFPETDICNPLDLIRNEEDGVGAAQLIEVISKNTDKSRGKGSGDKFFEDAGDTLVEGIFLVTKAVEKLAEGMVDNPASYCDLMMASAILSLPNLAHRLELAANTKLNVWTSRPLTQLISVKDSEKTASSIVGTSQRMFQKFLKKDFLGAFCGQTTLPLDLDGKQLLIFGLDRNNRDIVGPLLTAILHMIVSRNVSRVVPRKEPLVVALDELPTLYLPYLGNWINESREDGFCGIIGFQNLAQIEKIYGKEMTRIIFGGCGTKMIFNPQEYEFAKYFSDFLGEIEVKYKTKSRTSGTKGSRSRSQNENKQKKLLVEPAELLKMPTGKGIVLNPGMKQGEESYIPVKHRFKIPIADIKEQEWSESRWSVIQEAIVEKKGSLVTDEERKRQFDERLVLAERLFPLTEEENVASNQNLSTPPSKSGSQMNQVVPISEELKEKFQEKPLPPSKQAEKNSDIGIFF